MKTITNVGSVLFIENRMHKNVMSFLSVPGGEQMRQQQSLCILGIQEPVLCYDQYVAKQIDFKCPTP